MTAVEIKRHPDGTRYAQPYLGTNAVTGRPLRPYRRFPDSMTDAECERAAAEWLESIAPATGRCVSTRLGDLLALYISDLEAQGRPANTVRTYRTLAGYAAPLASRDARSVKVWELDALYTGLCRGGGRGGRPLAPDTVNAFHWFMSGAFNWIASLGLIASSPAAYVGQRPKPSRKEAQCIDGADLAALACLIDSELAAPGSSKDRLRRRAAALAAYLGLNMGLRVGEASALRRADIWEGSMQVHVAATLVEVRGGTERQPYTKGKRPRNIAITDRDVSTIAEYLGALPADPGSGPRTPLVTADGGWMRPTDVSRAVGALMRGAGLREGLGYHSLRHTHATWLLAHGADIKTVSERLGHADVATTLRAYAHVMPGRDRAAAELFAQAATGWEGSE